MVLKSGWAGLAWEADAAAVAEFGLVLSGLSVAAEQKLGCKLFHDWKVNWVRCFAHWRK